MDLAMLSGDIFMTVGTNVKLSQLDSGKGSSIKGINGINATSPDLVVEEI